MTNEKGNLKLPGLRSPPVSETAFLTNLAPLVQRTWYSAHEKSNCQARPLGIHSEQLIRCCIGSVIHTIGEH